MKQPVATGNLIQYPWGRLKARRHDELDRFRSLGRILAIPRGSLVEGVVYITPIVRIGSGRGIGVERAPVLIEHQPRNRRIAQQLLVKVDDVGLQLRRRDRRIRGLLDVDLFLDMVEALPLPAATSTNAAENLCKVPLKSARPCPAPSSDALRFDG